jgi:hypothetical protein
VAIFVLQLRSMSQRNQFDALLQAGKLFAERFPPRSEGGGDPLYQLRYRLPSRPEWGRRGYHRNLIERISAVRHLPPEVREADVKIITGLVNALNDLAELIDLKFLDARSILSKYHLAIVREVFIAEPYIYHEIMFSDRGRWGLRVLRLGEMARKYNDMNPVHRRSIYFMKGNMRDTEYGPIYLAPQSEWLRIYRLWWYVRRHLRGYPTISERTKRQQNRYLAKLEDETRHLR